MKRLRLLLLAIAVAFTPHTPSFAMVTGNEVARNCREGAPEELQCIHYVLGVTDTISFFDSASASPDLICIPNGVTNGQIIRVVTKFLDDNPDKQHVNSPLIIMAALKKAFPCPKER